MRFSPRSFLLTLPSILKCFVASHVELTVDEAHYVLYGRWLDWSYFDHPPMVGWLQGLMKILPFSELSVRAPALLIGLFLAFDIDRWLREKTKDEDLSLWIVMAIQFSPMLLGMTLVLLPETPFLFFSWILFRCLESTSSLTAMRAAMIGVATAGAGLSKYTAGLLIPGIFWEAHTRGWFKNSKNIRWIFFAIFISAVLISPVLVWNFQNDFSSFKYQADHVIQKQFSLSKLGISVLGMWAAFGFFLSPWIVFSFRLDEDSSWRLLQKLAVIPFLFFLYAATTSEVLPHWASVSFLFAFLVSLSRMWCKGLFWQKFLKFCVIATALIDVVLLSQLYFPFIPGAEIMSRDISGWKQSGEMLRKLKSVHPQVQGLITTHWTYGSRAVVYFSEMLPVHVVDERIDQYDQWLKPVVTGQDYFVLHHSYESQPVQNLVRCAELSSLKEETIRVGSKEIYHVEIWLCKNLKPF